MTGTAQRFRRTQSATRALVTTCAALLLGPGLATAQPVALGDSAETANATPTEKIGFSEGSFIVAPVPFQNPVLGAGLAIGGAYLFKNAEGAETSSLGFGYFRTENGSEGYGLGFDLQLGLSQWQTSVLLGDIDLTYDLFIEGVAVPIRQTATGIRLNGAREITETISVGVGLSYAETTVLGVDNSRLPVDLIPDADLQLAKFDISTEFDTRDNTDYPTEGLYAKGQLASGYMMSVRDRSYAKAVANLASYSPFLENDVFAWTVNGCVASENAPYFDACSLGGTDNFRGYGATEFIDRTLLSLQAEYRGRIHGILGDRLGYVVFAGAGGTGGSFGDVFENDLKYAYGVGARFRLSRSFPVDYAIDVSRNDTGESLVYVTVGQRF